MSNAHHNFDLEKYVRPGLTQQDVSNIFLVFTNIQEEEDAADEVKLTNVKDLPFFERPQLKDQLDALARQNMSVAKLAEQ